jgi:hypothetical protein
MQEFIVDQLLRMGIPNSSIRITAKDITLPCPYHLERTGKVDTNPSLGITVDGAMFFCLGCGAKGNWNKIAADFGLEKIDALRKYQGDMFAIAASRIHRLIEQKNELPPLTISVRRNWRGIPRKWLTRIDTSQWFDAEYNVERMLWPVFSMRSGRREMIGWTSRMIRHRVYKERDDFKNIPKHRNSPGLETSAVIFPEQHLAELRPKKLALVEGATDTAALLCRAIPAGGLLGIKKWKAEDWGRGLFSEKINRLVCMGVKKVLIVFDGDSAGRVAADRVLRDVSKVLAADIYDLPDRDDPAKTSESEYDEIKHALKNL